MRLHDFRALTFDVYGTLIDWETGIADALQPWAERHGVEAGREALLEAFGGAESRRQQENPEMVYPEVLELVFEDIARTFNVDPTPHEAAEFGASVEHWPAFSDSAPALAYLQQHYRLGVVSNVDRVSFVFSNDKLGVTFDIVVTAEDAGAYKPDPKPFHLALERMTEIGIAHDAILHTAQSLFHDHDPARRLGLTSCWIDRREPRGGGWGATPPPPEETQPAFRFPSMEALCEAHRREAGG